MMEVVLEYGYVILHKSIDVIADDGPALLDVFSAMSLVSDGVNLYFSESGIKARFNSKDHDVMMEVKVAKEAFSTYHIMGPHVQLGLYVADLVSAKNSKESRESYHILVAKGQEYFRSGPLGAEQDYRIMKIEASELPSPTEQDLPVAEPAATMTIHRALLEKILSGVLAIDSQVKFSILPDKLVVQNATSVYYAKYVRELPVEHPHLSISCIRPCEGFLDARMILKVIGLRKGSLQGDITFNLAEDAVILRSPINSCTSIALYFSQSKRTRSETPRLEP